ncbi:MAG TPA: hypothetical protein VGR14_19145 [Verrucomicrobiae bacterium]|jgi:hypothetical protein|nr:hypothetical protein [Verrucomicrobiae bacterium]
MNSDGGLIFDPVLPVPVIALLGLLLLIFTVRVYLSVGASVGPWRNGALMFFRLAGVALLLAVLLQPSRREFLPPPMQDRVTLIGLDSSLSMKQRDAGDKTRFDAVKNLLLESGALAQNGMPADPHLRFFEFSDDARPLRQSVLNLVPTGKTTLFHKSVGTMLSAAANDEAVNALILLTDGHDFELANPVKTGLLAHNRRASIYAVAFGQQGSVRDVAVRITGFQPYCYVKQKARIQATLRLVGCELEDLTVQLLRQGQVAQSKRVNAQQLQELPVEFEVTEPTAGQYEYEVRVLPLEKEVDTANNSAITYLNVIDQQIRVLLLEGDPYWDTTFLQRSLMRNDKFDVDALIRYAPNRVRAIRKTPSGDELHAPRTLDQFAAYDVIILGRSVDSLLDSPSGADASAAPANVLDQYVNERGGTVIFSRGRAFTNASAIQLEPVLWGSTARERVRLDVTAEGRALSPFRALNEGSGGLDALPELLEGKKPEATQPLTSTFAVEAGRDDAAPEAAIVHRRYGQGQVVSMGVAGLWRWALNSKVEGDNSPFDYFWDQMVLWLLAGRDFIPSRQYSFRPNSANILLGEKVYFRLVLRQPDSKLKSVPVTLFFGDQEVGRANMTPLPGSASRMTAEFLPERVGRYRAVVNLPDGTTQESRFIVFTENLEETEVATDALYLRRLCESSGGRLLEPGELPRLLKELSSEKTDQTPKTIVRPVWNVAWFYYLAGLLFGLDWFLRRRWGLC